MKKESESLIFCENIKMLREKENLSKAKMAKILGISVNTLTVIEKGILPQRLSCNVLFRIHQYFGIIPKDMFVRIIEMKK